MGQTATRRFYLAEVFDPWKRRSYVARVTSEGQCYANEVQKGIDLVDRWAMVTAADMKEAKAKFAEGRVVLWMS